MTLGGLAALVRGGRKGNFDVAVKRRGRKAGPGGDEAGKGNVDVDDLVGGPVEMKKLVGCFYSGIFWILFARCNYISRVSFFFASFFLFPKLPLFLSLFVCSSIYRSTGHRTSTGPTSDPEVPQGRIPPN